MKKVTGNKMARMTLSLCVLLCLIAALCGAGCTGTTPPAGDPPPAEIPTTAVGTVDRVEVFHFHTSRQCVTCEKIGALAEKTVLTYFPGELDSGRLVFAHVNVDEPENHALVEQYGPTGASLWIGVYEGSGFYKEEDIQVWYLTGDEDAFMDYLRAKIELRLQGDLT